MVRVGVRTDGPGATKLMRRKVHPPSSLLETFLTVEMWKGTRRPWMGMRTASCLPSTKVWCVLSGPPPDDDVGYWLASR